MTDNNTVEKFPVLYVFVRNDLESMTPGKAEAHSGHAANAFVNETIVRPLLEDAECNPLALEWQNATSQGFGTQINLNANYEQMTTAVEVAQMMGFTANVVVDPTYPYEVPAETAMLINPTVHTMDPINKGTTSVLFREEITAAYVFGDKNDPLLSAVVGKFGLKP